MLRKIIGILVIVIVAGSGSVIAQDTFSGDVPITQTLAKSVISTALGSTLDTGAITNKEIAEFTINNNVRSGYTVRLFASRGVLLASGTTGSDTASTSTKNIVMGYQGGTLPEEGDYLDYTVNLLHTTVTPGHLGRSTQLTLNGAAFFDTVAADARRETETTRIKNFNAGASLLRGTTLLNADSTAAGNFDLGFGGTASDGSGKYKIDQATEDGKFKLRLTTVPSTKMFYDTYSDTVTVQMITY